MIQLNKVWYAYHPGSDGGAWALRDVDLVVDRGEFVAVAGANGSGKSTLAKHLNALLVPTRGTVTVAGLDTREEAHRWTIRRRVGMVFQNPDNQLVATTVEEDVAFGPENLGVDRKELRRRVDEALAAVGMAEMRTRAPHHLSGGQKQRIAIAGILAMQPDVIVLDEPTSMLDPAGRADVLATVKRLHRERGLTIVYVTHFMEEALQADRLVVMRDGCVYADGKPKSVLQEIDHAAAGLDWPPAMAMARALRERGVAVDDGETLDGLVDALCRLRSRT